MHAWYDKLRNGCADANLLLLHLEVATRTLAFRNADILTFSSITQQTNNNVK